MRKRHNIPVSGGRKDLCPPVSGIPGVFPIDLRTPRPTDVTPFGGHTLRDTPPLSLPAWKMSSQRIL
ncbi:hypothetical protein TNCV_112631 [Trichonephila clavipes]|nr:hypothetical protein TNCV_112631 [Trichonephila clavipes]